MLVDRLIIPIITSTPFDMYNILQRILISNLWIVLNNLIKTKVKFKILGRTKKKKVELNAVLF